jgi:hypothetical protein
MQEKLLELYEAVCKMRDLQTEYWKTKNFVLINKIKNAENRVDKLTFEIKLLENG